MEGRAVIKFLLWVPLVVGLLCFVVPRDGCASCL